MYPSNGWIGRSETLQDSTLNYISSRTCSPGAKSRAEFWQQIVSDNCDSVSSPSWGIASSCMMCTRNILSRQEWQVGLKSGSGSKGPKKNFMTRARIAHSVEIWSQPTFPKSPNLIYVSFSLVSGNFIYS